MTDDELDQLCDSRQILKDLQATAQGEIDGITQQIGAELGARAVDKVETARYIPRILIQERHALDKGKLLDMGVPIQTIEACTVGTVVQSIRVDKRKAGK